MTSNALYDGKRLDEWLLAQDPNSFPPGADDPQKRYTAIHSHLCKKYYPQVGMAALWAEVRAGRAPIYLTNHGAEHVQHVISKATELLQTSTYDLNDHFQSYEVFLLLTAILFHDLGNAFGREDHQKKCQKLMNGLGSGLFPDEAEKRIISKIAAAHCGIVDGSSDAIGQLDDSYRLLGQKVHKQALASVLRLADELADDRTRASRFMLDDDLLEGSEVYHRYSYALRSAMVGDAEIKLDFELARNLALRKLHKGSERVYLLDEIYERTLKTHMERVYCMRFLGRHVSVSQVRVKIEVFDHFDPERWTKPIRDPISYCLRETGYPEQPPGGIHSLCPELKGLTGKELKRKLK